MEKNEWVFGDIKDVFWWVLCRTNQAYAIKIGALLPYDNPIDPYERWDSFVPPQSFRYVDDLIEEPEFISFWHSVNSYTLSLLYIKVKDSSKTFIPLFRSSAMTDWGDFLFGGDIQIVKNAIIIMISGQMIGIKQTQLQSVT